MKTLLILITYICMLLAFMCIYPALLLMSVNTLSDLGGSTFYIPHSPMSYLSATVLLVVLKIRFNTYKE